MFVFIRFYIANFYFAAVVTSDTPSQWKAVVPQKSVWGRRKRVSQRLQQQVQSNWEGLCRQRADNHRTDAWPWAITDITRHLFFHIIVWFSCRTSNNNRLVSQNCTIAVGPSFGGLALSPGVWMEAAAEGAVGLSEAREARPLSGATASEDADTVIGISYGRDSDMGNYLFVLIISITGIVLAILMQLQPWRWFIYF